jgi:GAF domain-containing protein/anti-sigma regulatory factor (Ser/Thr protein kinase)
MEAQSLHDVNKVSELLVRTPGKPGDLNSVLRHIVQTAQDAFATDACVMLAFNPITSKFIGSQIVGNLQVKNEELHDKPRPEGVTRQVLREGSLFIEDLEATPQYHNRFTRKEGFRAFAGLALRSRHRQRSLGVIYLDFRHPRKFSPADCDSFRIFAVQAAFLLQETWLAHHYEEVARIGQQVNQNLATPEDLFQVLQTYVDSVLDESHTLMLAVLNSRTITLDIHLSKNRQATYVDRPLGVRSACKYIIETQEIVFISQLSKEKEQLPFEIINITGTEEEESFIFVPLVLREVSLGVLSIQHSQSGIYGQEDLFVLQLLASYISLALHNMRLYDSLNQLHEAGQLLTQQLESEQTLQATVDKLREATQADVVILYPYEANRQRFILPPRIAGILSESFPQGMGPRQPNDVAAVALRLEEPIFAKESATIYNSMHHDVRLREENFQQREKVRSTAVMPLRVGDDSVGVLFINFRQPQRFDATQKKLIDGLAHYAAIAIKNAQEYGSLIQRRVHELEILQDIDRALNRTLDLDEVLYTLLRLAREHVPAEEASILLHNSKTQILATAAAIGRHAEASQAQKILLWETKGITQWVVKHKKAVRIENLRRDVLWRDLHLPVADDIVSELDVPLLDGEEVIGVLNFESTKEAAFSQADQDFLVTLAGQAVLAIKNAQAYEREKRLVAESQVLNEISKEITSQLDLAHIFDVILEKALELTHATVGNLMIYDPERNDLWMAAERGVAKEKKGQRQKLDQGVVGYAARTKQLLNIDLSQQPWVSVNLDFIPGTRFELAVPMLAGTDLIGILNVENHSSDNFTESDERLLLALADLAVVALQNAQTYEREKRLAEESQVLNDISKEIISQLDITYVFDLILGKALELTHSTLCSLMLYDPDQDDLWMAAERGVAADKKGKRQNLGQGIVGYVAVHKQPLNVDPSQPPWNKIYVEFASGVRSELAVPMLAGNELRGVLNVESSTPDNFDESDQRLLQGLADLAVVALQNAQTYAREKRLAEELQVLNDISKEITSQLDHVYVFELILEESLKLTQSTLGSVHLYDSDRNDLWMAAERGVAADKKGKRQNLGQGIVGYVAAHQKSLNIGDVSQPPWDKIFLEFFPGTRSELAVPMLEGNHLRGVVNVESPSLNQFNESNERLLQELADLAVIALQNAESYEKAEREAQRFKLLYQAGQELSKITNLAQLEQAYGIIVQIAGKQSEGQVVIYRYDEENEEVVLACASHRRAPLFERIKMDEGLNGQVAREHRTIVIHDVDHLPPDVVSVKQSDPSMHSLVVTPIFFEDQYYGNLGLRHEDAGHFRGADINFFEALAQQLASTIYRLETAKARQESEERALSAEEMSSIGQTAFEVTHRLGNDLGLVESYIADIQTELKRLGVTNGFVFKKLGNILQSVQAVLSFSSDLKQEMAKLGATEETVGEPVLISPRELLEEASIIPLLQPNIQIRLEVDDDVAAVLITRSLVAHILRNLVTNAIQAMPKGGTIILRGRNTGRYVALEVIDTGIGIPEQKLSQVFDLFFSTKGSSGFGLWSARRSALKNRGDLKVASKKGQGTTFTLLLPRTDKGIS